MKTTLIKVISIVLVLGSAYWSLTSQLPSEISNKDTPKSQFSTERALIHLKQISKKPHYVGTEAHTEVRDYLISELEKMGLTVETQTQIAFQKKWRCAVNAKNVIAKIKGSENGKSLVLLSHYDSAVHSSYGASDAGSGVVTILETVRAFLEKGKQPKNDIIILFADAEEIGLLGAVAFVKHHVLAKNIGLVLNLEARGSGGPSYMLLETNGGNNTLIKSFTKAKPNFPVANSLMYSIYKMLPNDTDLTVFREDGNINGFNFAFIDDHYDYHTSQDTYENLDRNTLEQQGDYLTTMLQYFAFSSLEDLNSKADDVYFSLQKVGLITYPFSWIITMFVIALVLFFVITFYGVQIMRLKTSAMFAGFIPFLGSIITVTLIAVYGWKTILLIHPQYKEMLHGFTYNGYWYIFGFIFISLGITFWIYKRFFRKYSAENLLVAPLFVWGILNFFIVIYLKGAAFFIIPIYFSLTTLLILLLAKEKKNRLLISTLFSIPTMLVFFPLIMMFPVGLGLQKLGVSALFVALLFGLFVPVFQQWKNTTLLSRAFLLIGGISLIFGSAKSGYSEDRKQPVSLNYVVDLNKKKAYFASYDSKVNAFTKPYLGENPTQGSFDETAADSKYHTNINLFKETKMVNLKEAIILIQKDTIIKNDRIIDISVYPQRKTNRMELIATNTIHFKSFVINNEEGIAFNTENKKNILTYYFTEENEELHIQFSIPKEEHPEIIFYDTVYDLYTNDLISVKPITDNTMFPMPFVINEATIIKKKIAF